MNTPGMRCAIALQEIGIGITQDTEQLASFIDEKIGKPAQQEPFGYFRYDLRLDAWVQNRAGLTGTPFYTRPPAREWVGLTEAEIGALYKAGWSNNMDFARAIEAKLKEKNT